MADGHLPRLKTRRRSTYQGVGRLLSDSSQARNLFGSKTAVTSRDGLTHLRDGYARQEKSPEELLEEEGSSQLGTSKTRARDSLGPGWSPGGACGTDRLHRDLLRRRNLDVLHDGRVATLLIAGINCCRCVTVSRAVLSLRIGIPRACDKRRVDP